MLVRAAPFIALAAVLVVIYIVVVMTTGCATTPKPEIREQPTHYLKCWRRAYDCEEHGVRHRHCRWVPVR